MNCSQCGAFVPDGQPTCPNCGAAMYQQPMQQQPMYQQPMQQQPMYQQPMQQQPMYQQPMQQPMYQQPMQQQAGANLGAYFSNLTKDPMNILRIVGAVLLLLAPIFPWAAAKVWGIKFGSTSMWGGGVLALLSALAITAIAALLICIEIADYVPALSKIKPAMPSAELIILAVVLVLAILNTFVFKIKAYGESASLSEVRDGGSVVYGFGFFLTYISLALCAVPRFIKKK